MQVPINPAWQLSAVQFRRYWISFWGGSISVGLGQPTSKPLLQWQDDLPVPGMRHIGLAAWDKFLAYRNVQMHVAIPKPLYVVPVRIHTNLHV